MKVTPRNQTLILASERDPSGAAPMAAPRSFGGDPVLKRVTIVASRPYDTLLYLQADYSPIAESPVRAASPTATALAALTPLDAPPASAVTAPPGGGRYASNRHIELYSSTQRLLADAPTTRIDVHA